MIADLGVELVFNFSYPGQADIPSWEVLLDNSGGKGAEQGHSSSLNDVQTSSDIGRMAAGLCDSVSVTCHTQSQLSDTSTVPRNDVEELLTSASNSNGTYSTTRTPGSITGITRKSSPNPLVVALNLQHASSLGHIVKGSRTASVSRSVATQSFSPLRRGPKPSRKLEGVILPSRHALAKARKSRVIQSLTEVKAPSAVSIKSSFSVLTIGQLLNISFRTLW